jgi:hypothetical protein
MSNQIHLYQLSRETWSKRLCRRRRPPPACSMSNRLSNCYARLQNRLRSVAAPSAQRALVHTLFSPRDEICSRHEVVAHPGCKGISFSPGESLSKFYPLVVGIDHVRRSVITVRILGQLESNRTGMQILLIERKTSEGMTSKYYCTCIYITVGTLFFTNHS